MAGLVGIDLLFSVRVLLRVRLLSGSEGGEVEGEAPGDVEVEDSVIILNRLRGVKEGAEEEDEVTLLEVKECTRVRGLDSDVDDEG